MSAATPESRHAVTWAAGTLKASGFRLHAAEHGTGWDVESPKGNWFAAENWRELCGVAQYAMAARRAELEQQELAGINDLCEPGGVGEEF